MAVIFLIDRTFEGFLQNVGDAVLDPYPCHYPYPYPYPHRYPQPHLIPNPCL